MLLSNLDKIISLNSINQIFIISCFLHCIIFLISLINTYLNIHIFRLFYLFIFLFCLSFNFIFQSYSFLLKNKLNYIIILEKPALYCQILLQEYYLPIFILVIILFLIYYPR